MNWDSDTPYDNPKPYDQAPENYQQLYTGGRKLVTTEVNLIDSWLAAPGTISAEVELLRVRNALKAWLSGNPSS